MTLSREQVRHVAKLARLELEPGEEEFYAQQLSAILTHIDRLAALDTGFDFSTAQVIEGKNVMREDELESCLSQQDALFNAPDHEGGQIAVKAIIDSEP